jgi:hypothetical protein
LPLQPIFPPELLDVYHDKLPSLFGPPLFNTDEILGDVLARTVFNNQQLTKELDIRQLCAYILEHRTLVPMQGTSVMVDSLSLNFAHKCRTKCGETEGCNTIAARIKVNVTECLRPHTGFLTDNETLTLKESMVTKYLFDKKLDKASWNKTNSLEVDPDAILGKVSGKCLDKKPKNSPFTYSASCDLYNEGQITVVSGAKPICMLLPGTCDMKVGQIIRMKNFRGWLDFDIYSNKSSYKPRSSYSRFAL